MDRIYIVYAMTIGHTHVCPGEYRAVDSANVTPSVRKNLGETRDPVRTDKKTRAFGGVSQDVFDKELSMLQPTLTPSPSPSLQS
ncbi:hypothetical protein M422DRAFT_259482 [Sphaerobolus stellatus SS14]|uniref:Uncharacterized protein n=1 Tax=Sphaerobolus stellatus (strain SS14) TaxID=990650 RepID=A0A0C9U4L3_SPHS4|nr:hypothetical protein M422DRAFT_259482 [Sphaerobolus stellatus SS14]